MNSSLIRGRYVVCGVDAAGTAEILNDAAVLQADGIIQAVGPYEALHAQHPGIDVVGSSKHVVCPGFVNSHHHVGLTPLQMGIPDLPLELWMVRRIGCRAVDPYLDTLYSAFELLSSGVTTVQHLHGRASKPVNRIVEVASEIIRAYQDVGMRVSYSYGLRDQNHMVYEADETFLGRLPPEIAGLARELVGAQTLSIDESIAVFESLRSKFADEDRVAIQLAPVNLHWCSDEAIGRTVETARTAGVPMHMHVLETPFQQEYALKRTGRSAVAHLQYLGALGPDLTIGHGVWATEADIEILAATGTCVCHNCSSNLRLRSGIAPINLYVRHGVRVALGLDEAGLNDDRDMLQEMRLVLNLHRVPGMDESAVPTPAGVLRMATENGASTTPFAARIGRIGPGRAADLLLFDWDGITFPYLDEAVGVVDALVQRARAKDLHAVMVAGEVVLCDGVFSRVDRALTLATFAARLRAPLTPAEERNRQLGPVLAEYAREVYAEYESARRDEPFRRRAVA